MKKKGGIGIIIIIILVIVVALVITIFSIYKYKENKIIKDYNIEYYKESKCQMGCPSKYYDDMNITNIDIDCIYDCSVKYPESPTSSYSELNDLMIKYPNKFSMSFMANSGVYCTIRIMDDAETKYACLDKRLKFIEYNFPYVKETE